MKKITVIFLLLASAFFFCVGQYHRILRAENARLKANQSLLLQSQASDSLKMESYKVADSLNAIKIKGLELTLDEYKKYKEDNLELIKQLNIRKAELVKTVDLQATTIRALSMQLKDIIVNDQEPDTLKCFIYESKWLDISGCVSLVKDSVNLKVNNREELRIFESVKYKRFLGFLWRTNHIKERSVSVISLNPHTTITNADFVSVNKD